MIPYTLSYSFTGYQAINPARPLPAPEVDVQFSNIAASIASVIAAVGQVRRADGAIQNGSVTFDSLDPQLAAILGGANDITVPDINPTAFSTQVEAEVGVSNDKIVTPLRTAQAIAAQRPFASQTQAQSGVDTSDTVMTPLRTRESITARRPFASTAQAQNGVNTTTVMSPARTSEAIDARRPAFTATANLTFGAIGAGASVSQTVSVAGAEVGDGVVVGLPAAGLNAGLVPFAWVSSAGSVTLRITNITGGSITPAVADYRLTAIRF
jgi:hypothetical protein